MIRAHPRPAQTTAASFRKAPARQMALKGDMDLVALVERARAGDVEAFTELVRRHQTLALGAATALLRDPDRARDIVQEAFVAAWRGLARLADPSAFPAWLRGIVRRQAFH